MDNPWNPAGRGLREEIFSLDVPFALYSFLSLTESQGASQPFKPFNLGTQAKVDKYEEQIGVCVGGGYKVDIGHDCKYKSMMALQFCNKQLPLLLVILE